MTTQNKYATFVNKIKGGIKEALSTEEAIKNAVDWCIDNNILKDYLVKHKSEVVGMVLTEYNEKKHIALRNDNPQHIWIADGGL